MKRERAILDHVVWPEGGYAHFHFAMIGKEFSDGLGKTYTKQEVWIQFRKSPTILKMIVNGSYKELRAVDKNGWQNGVLLDKRSYTRDEVGCLVLR